MRLDLVIPTFRRPALVRAALASVARAARPRALEVSVTVVNNDLEPLVLERQLTEGPYPVRVLHERRAGKSAALNAGIAASTADYIGLIDDDEEIAQDWLQVVERALESREYDFIGGPAVLQSTAAAPSWIPPGYAAVLGSWHNGDVPVPYGQSFPGILMGGNAVISRAMLLAVGPYSTTLGPRVDRRLSSCEDEDMYWRLVHAGARGQYLPDLLVRHHVHPDRLQKRYYRSWCFWNGASKTTLSQRLATDGPHIAGVPRYVWGEALRGMGTWLKAGIGFGTAAERTAGELAVWHLAGRLYGRLAPPRTLPSQVKANQPRPYQDDRTIGSSTS
jgi:glycosyltransferase involved in cell wall biosynthesis